jgi:hypothetical protein
MIIKDTHDVYKLPEIAHVVSIHESTQPILQYYLLINILDLLALGPLKTESCCATRSPMVQVLFASYLGQLRLGC